MKYELIIVRYGEIALKGKETRRRFENTLVNNMKNALNAENLSFKIKKEWGRMYVYTDQINAAVNVLKKVFGITSVSPAVQVTVSLESISDIAVSVSKEFLTKEKTFAVRTSRTGDHSFSSQDVSVKIGSDIVDAIGSGVNLANPDFRLFIEIRNDKAFIFTERIRAVGGMPLGTQGVVIALIDSSHSILAAWYIMRRGCKAIFAVTDDSLKDNLKSFTENWYAKLDMFIIKDGENIFKTLEQATSEKNCSAVVTGHTLSTNPEQELSEIKLFTKNISYPIIHPLIAMEKDEIKEKCKEIGLEL